MSNESKDFPPMDLSKIMEGLGDVGSIAGDHVEGTITAFFGALQKGIMPKKILNLGEDQIETIYTQSYTMYNQGKYKEASYLFTVLMCIDPTVPKHVMGFAACCHRQDMYEKAIELYILCSSLDTENPLPDFHAADCWIKLQSPEAAVVHLKNAIERAKDIPEHAIVKERAIMMIQTLEAEIEAGKKGASAKEQEKNS